jgi:hypothetical protein
MRFRIAAILAFLALAAGCSTSNRDSGTDKSTKDSTKATSSSTKVTKQDAYAIGCPLVNTALGAGTVARKLAAAGLGRLADSGALTPDQKQWVSDAKDLVSASKPDDVPGSVRERVRQACAEHGQTLSNL